MTPQEMTTRKAAHYGAVLAELTAWGGTIDDRRAFVAQQADSLSVSQKTISNRIRELIDLGVIRHQLTPRGRLKGLTVTWLGYEWLYGHLHHPQDAVAYWAYAHGYQSHWVTAGPGGC